MRLLATEAFRAKLRDSGGLPNLRRLAVRSGGAYTPALPADLVHRLWELKEASGIPMTKLLARAVENFLLDHDQQEPADRSCQH